MAQFKESQLHRLTISQSLTVNCKIQTLQICTSMKLILFMLILISCYIDIILYLYYSSFRSILNKSYSLLACVFQLVQMLDKIQGVKLSNFTHCNEVMTYCNTMAGLHIFVINKLIFRQTTTFIVYSIRYRELYCCYYHGAISMIN